MIETNVIQIETNDFAIGKMALYPGQEDLFLFDIQPMEMLQLSSTNEIKVRHSLKNIAALRQIDTVFFDTGTECLVIADSIANKLFKSKVTVGENSTVSLAKAADYPLNPGSIIVAAAVVGEEYWLLDKGNSMLRIYNKDFDEIKTVGSRMGYVLAYGEEAGQRLGFEFPEDMAVSTDRNRVVVSDSGNKRLVVLSIDIEKSQWKLEKAIMLPEFPFKIIAWDEGDERVTVSDFDRSVMTVSLKYGFVSQEELKYPVDFGGITPGLLTGKRLYVNSERKGEIVSLTLPERSLEVIAEAAENFQVLLRIWVDQERFDDARQLVKAHNELLPHYMKYKPSGDESLDEPLTAYVKDLFNTVIEDNNKLSEEVKRLSHDFIVKYKSIPNSEDIEAANIDKENIRHKMFLKLKQFRKGLKELAELKVIVRNSAPAASVLAGLLDKRFDSIKERLLAHLKEIDKNLDKFSELDFLKAIVYYWLLSEEEAVLFREQKFKYRKIFGKKFLLAVLNDFYYHIAELFLDRQKTDQYISFADREITMYPDKMGIFKIFVNRLIILRKYDDVLRMLKKIPDPNKENVNFYYYQVYLGKGEKPKAFQHLKKELDLYPHRQNLIPQLIQLDQLTPGETQQYIGKILEKSGHSIDLYFNTAQAFKAIGDFTQAEFYVDKELELFPENKQALQLKFVLFFSHPDGSMDSGYYRKSWEIFKNFIRFNRDEIIALHVIGFFTVLNYVTLDALEIKELVALKDTIIFDLYKRELSLYLSFITHFPTTECDPLANLEPAIETYGCEAYLSAYSTRRLAYDFYFEEVKRLAAAEPGDMEKMFERIESILKYNPGDEEIFRFLDRLSLKGEEVIEKV